MPTPETPLIVKTHDFLLWLIEALELELAFLQCWLKHGGKE